MFYIYIDNILQWRFYTLRLHILLLINNLHNFIEQAIHRFSLQVDRFLANETLYITVTINNLIISKILQFDTLKKKRIRTLAIKILI